MLSVTMGTSSMLSVTKFLAFGDHSCLEMLGFVGVGSVLHLRGCSLFLVFWGGSGYLVYADTQLCSKVII